MSLALAKYMGYKTIYICGLDNDAIENYSVNINNEIFENNVHFYNLDGDPVNLTPHFTGKNMETAILGMSLLFDDLKKFRQDNEIINLDPTGYITTFSKRHDLDVYL